MNVCVKALLLVMPVPLTRKTSLMLMVWAGDVLVKLTVPILTRPLTSTVADAPLLVKVAVPSGKSGLEVQFAGSIHSVGSPALFPSQVPSTACADTTPSALVASNTASECRVPDRSRCSGSIMRIFGLVMAPSARVVSEIPGIGWNSANRKRSLNRYSDNRRACLFRHILTCSPWLATRCGCFADLSVGRYRNLQGRDRSATSGPNAPPFGGPKLGREKAQP